MALAALIERAAAAGIEVLALSPRRGDFNDDLQAFGLRELRAALRPQLAPQDADPRSGGDSRLTDGGSGLPRSIR